MYVCIHTNSFTIPFSPTQPTTGGQLKRLSVGVEIINPPSLLFLDEPTSGPHFFV